MENWMNHPAMKTIDPLKLELIRTAAKQTKGKSGNELAPVMLALITNANRQGLRFNPDEVSLILEVLKEGKSKEEQNQIDRMMEMTKNIFRKHFKENQNHSLRLCSLISLLFSIHFHLHQLKYKG